MKQITILLTLLMLTCALVSFGQVDREKTYKGRYKGYNLKIRNPYSLKGKSYCIKTIYINDEVANVPLDNTSLEVDLSKFQKNDRISIRIIYQSDCTPLATNLADIL